MRRITLRGQNFHRLDHMRMGADDHVDSELTELLCDGFLPVDRLQLIFVSPVNIQDNQLRSVGLQLCDSFRNLCV